ncbi:DUF2937 family protein [Magnetospira sp. QH-2]|uniref:DUF2937 family protein n=1 Tax=Magnetospira sp. (strain QH-2) TaxID=1288970 RepID=UPI0003E818BC|nr:DUF2937 family protein [Magnetospira sp. QH-2]CCQ72361.1 Conserved membrane protein of unknown function [Magnetospira sp. QH-2]
MIREFFAIFFAVFFGMAFSQVPPLIQQYEQRLGGAVGELTTLADQYAENANRSNLTLGTYVSRHMVNPDPVMQKTGRTMRRSLDRLDALERGMDALDRAPIWKKPWVLVQNNDQQIMQDTWSKFAFTLTIDLRFGAVGVLFGFLFNHFLVMLLRPPQSRGYL